MESKWLTGYDFIREVNMNDVDIIEYVINGLQPYDNAMQPMLPLHAAEWTYIIRELREDIEVIEKQFPTIKNSDYSDWSILNLDRVVDDNNNLLKIEFPDGSDSEIRGQYEEKKAQLEKLEIKLNKYSALPSWVGYELPLRKKDRVAVIDQLLRALYKRIDIDNLEKIESNINLRDVQALFKNENLQETAGDIIDNAFIRQDGYWEIRYKGSKLEPIMHQDGLTYIAHLLNHPGKEINVSDLYETVHPKEGLPMVSNIEMAQLIKNGEMSNSDMTIDQLDHIAKKQILKEIKDLKESIETAETNIEKRESENELNRLIECLKVYGKNPLSHRAPKKHNESVKKHADTVSKTIKDAIKKIDKKSPSLADYLSNEDIIKRGRKYIFKDKLIWKVSL